METRKAKSAAKIVISEPAELRKVISDTFRVIADVVGSTLGPGGRVVVIDRPEDLPPMVTKDGVTVFKSLGFLDSAKQTVLEAARGAAIKTAEKAGDGTSTCTVLAYSIDDKMDAFCKANPSIPPQRVARELRSLDKDIIGPALDQVSVLVDPAEEDGRYLMQKIATTSANGDSDLAEKVMECFDVSGDEGNVTITEKIGSSGYKVEHISGYPIAMGYEDALRRFSSVFVNDGSSKVYATNPAFVLYNGALTTASKLDHVVNKVIHNAIVDMGFTTNIVIVADSFSDSVLATCASSQQYGLKLFPLPIPMSREINYQRKFLEDLAVLTGGKVFDDVQCPLSTAEIDDIAKMYKETDEEGNESHFWNLPKAFEMTRFRSTIIEPPTDEETAARIEVRVAALRAQKDHGGVAEMDKAYLQERIAKITGGIARLICEGASVAETKEARDRAEDAVCAVRAAIKDGALPGGGWGLAYAAANLNKLEGDSIRTRVAKEVLVPALKEPLLRLFRNAGLMEDEIQARVLGICTNADMVLEAEEYRPEEAKIVDLQNPTHEIVSALSAGVIDAAPAVKEAVSNAISVAAQLGTTGGLICFPRDFELEKKEALQASQMERYMAQDRSFADNKA